MRYLKTFEGIFSSLKKNGISKYLVKYNVTNYDATKEEWDQGKHSKNWNSKDYEYSITANSEEEAKNKFSDIWNKKVDSFEPRPKLNIISVKFINDKETIGSFKNKIHFS